ncbi:piezo-type mechanosensitive ion channel component-like protein, partial [Leptotrombidium deliense]
MPLQQYAPICYDTTPLLSTQKKSYQTLKQRRSLNLDRSGLDVDSNGSVIWKNDPLDVSSVGSPAVAGMATTSRVDSPVTPGGKTEKSNRLAPVIYIVNLLKKSSYAGTLIVMMTWSITYHSWLTFVLLLWSCLIWMIPNSRRACLRSSPALVTYAILLIFGQYIFSLTLNENELPQKPDGVNLNEIGLKKYYQYSYKPLIVKILYTLMFWITLRQYIEEKQRDERERRQNFSTSFNASQTASVGAPRVSIPRHMSLATTMLPANFSPSFLWISNEVQAMLVKYWIWIVACMLMVMSLSGQKVVLIRIVYMFLFLSFVLMFQHTITEVMFSFYRQRDIGLEVYDQDPLILFTQLFTPTFFLIITIIQVHFLHKDFMEFSKYEDQSVTPVMSDETRLTPSALTNSSLAHNLDEKQRDEVALDLDKDVATTSSISELDSSKEQSLKSPVHQHDNSSTFVTPEHQVPETKDKGNVHISDVKMVASELKSKALSIWESVKPALYSFYEVFWRFLEIHVMKVVFLCAMIAAVSEVTVANFIFVALIVLGLPFQRFEQIISYAFGIWASILILAKMLFQLGIASDLHWDINCTNDLVMVLILTLNAVVIIRQRLHRYRHHEICPPPGIIFIKISRKDADKGIVDCLKYFANFAFYKFGIEITAIIMSFLIAYRMDIISLLLSLWLFVFGLTSRNFIAKMWPVFIGMLCILLPLQYLMSLGIPPGLCTEYPWVNLSLTLQNWLYLPSFQLHPLVNKLYFDFFVLLFASRQLLVFCIEKSNTHYEGGDNSEHGTTQFSRAKEAVKDYFTFKRTLIDSIKSILFSCFYWITLAVLFLTAIGYFNLFGLGYILGCFLFLWSGNEFYLKPVNSILRIWKCLIAYSIAVIFVKTILDLIGCLYILELTRSLCWVVHLLGITCSQTTSGAKFDKCYGDAAMSGQISDNSGLFRDCVCFAFLLIQKRIFGSHYFAYLAKEVKAQHVLASRGAELIHEIQAKEVAEQEEAEREVMEKIKMKVDKIRSRQQKEVGEKGQKIKTHYQGKICKDYGYDLSPCYSTAEATVLHTPETEHPLSSTLPSIFSPTPSLPTAASPSSAVSPAKCLGYVETFKVPLRQSDPLSSETTAPSISPCSSPLDDTCYSPTPCSPLPMRTKISKEPTSLQLSTEMRILSRPSFKIHQKPSRPVSAISSFHRKHSSSASVEASHGSSVRSGDYHMFEDPDAEEIDLERKPRKSLIPDPVGDELKKIANVRGLTAFCSKLVKGQISEDDDATKFSGETSEIGDSSRDSAIVSVDRDVPDSEVSAVTTYTSVPSSPPSHSQFVASTSHASALEESLDKHFHSDSGTKESAVAADSEQKPTETFLEKVKRYFLIAKLFSLSCIISATAKLNDVSRDYRYVSRRLAVEKRALKVLFEMEETEGVQYDENWKKE